MAIGACFAAHSLYFLTLAKLEYSFCGTLLSVAVLHLRIRHSPTDWGILAAATLILMAIAVRVEHFPLPVRICCALVGLASLVILATRTLWCKPSEITVPLWALAAAVVLVGSGWILPPFLTWAGQGTPKVLDLYLCSFDASLGFQPSFAMGTLLFKWPILGQISGTFYMGVPIIVTLVYGDRLLQGVRKALPAFLAFFLVAPIGSLFYDLFPALGPVYVFAGSFPVRPLPASLIQHMRLEPLALGGFRNAMPSLHMAWAILGLWYSRGTAWWIRVFAWVFFVFTVISTLGMGEHYLIDLIVAFPFALMIYGVFCSLSGWKDAWRIRAIAFGFAATILWMVLLRFQPSLFWVSPVIPWSLMILTLAATLALKWRVQVASEPAAIPVTPGSVAHLSPEL